MWFWRRRERQPPPVLLPSLDRLAELIGRVVDLLDAPALPPPRGEGLVARKHDLPAPDPGWVAFLSTPAGYRLAELEGSAPGRGDAVEVEGRAWTVLGLGPSPLPGDARRCAYLEGEERPAEERTFEP